MSHSQATEHSQVTFTSNRRHTSPVVKELYVGQGLFYYDIKYTAIEWYYSYNKTALALLLGTNPPPQFTKIILSLYIGTIIIVNTANLVAEWGQRIQGIRPVDQAYVVKTIVTSNRRRKSSLGTIKGGSVGLWLPLGMGLFILQLERRLVGIRLRPFSSSLKINH